MSDDKTCKQSASRGTPPVARRPPAPRSGRSLFDRLRRELPAVVYLDAERLGRAEDVAATLDAETLALCRSALAGDRRALKAAAGRLKLAAGITLKAEPFDLEATLEAGGSADYVIHDRFFGIWRAEGDRQIVLLHDVFEAIVLLQRDLAGTISTLSDERLRELDRGLRVIAALLLGGPAPDGRIGRRSHRPVGDTAVPRRWARGHHVFTVLTQGLIVACNELEHAVAVGETGRRAEAADAIVALLVASGASLEFTGDFPADYYDRIIRTSMAPPHQPQGFSGLLSRDHRHLVRRMKETRPAFDAVRSEDPQRMALIAAALGAVYDSHKAVCSRFVGIDSKSLLMASETARAGVVQLDHFRANRLRFIGEA